MSDVPPLHKRTLDRIDASGDCWVWTGKLTPDGYAPHLRIWRLLVGPIPAGLTLDHLCRNRACVNPDHHEPVTQAENSRRGYSASAINSRKTQCPRGHLYDQANTWRDAQNYRHCRTCRALDNARVRRGKEEVSLTS